jgi:divalent metal cation (Fe/Co/Zn/Cd) transporter
VLADARHHRSDVLATILVVVAFLGARWNVSWLDGAMGIGVALLIGWAAYDTMRHSVGPLIGTKAPEEMYREIERIARSAPEVRGVHDILVHRYGNVNIISLHIEVAAGESAMRLHEVGEAIEDRLARRFPGHAIVHVDPLTRDHEHYETVQRIVEEAVAESADTSSYHDLRVFGSRERLKVVFDAVPAAGGRAAHLTVLREKVERRLSDTFPNVRILINVEPPYLHSEQRAPRD